MRILIFISTLWLVFPAKSQLDSLRDRVETYISKDTARVDLLNDFAEAYRQVKPDSCILLGEEAFALAKELNYTSGKAWALIRIASGYWMKGKYPETLSRTLEAIQLFEEMDDQSGLAQSLNTIANTYNMQGDHRKALEYYDQSISSYRALDDTYNVNRALANMGRTHYMIGEYEKGLTYLNQVVENLGDQRDNILYPIVHNTIGDIRQAKGDLEGALEAYLIAYPVAEVLNLPRIITYSTRGISEVYQRLENLEMSNRFANQTLSISEDIGYIENVKNANLILSQNYRATGDHRQALIFYQAHIAAKDSMFSLEKQKDIQRLRESYELSQQQGEIELLKTQQALQIQDNKNQRIILYSLLIVISLISALAISMYRRAVLKQRTNRLLTEQRNRLSNQNLEINSQRAVLQEQSDRLSQANQLKDRLFSIISHDLKSPFSILLPLTEQMDSLSQLSPEEIKSFTASMKKKIESLYEMLSNLLVWSRMQMDGSEVAHKEFDMVDMVNRSLTVFAEVAKEKNIRLTADMPSGVILTGDEAELSSVVRNLINNAIKFTHRDGEVEVSMSLNTDHLKVCVHDDGVGIPPDKLQDLFTGMAHYSTEGTANETGSGIGLQICKDAIDRHGGRIWAESEEGRGTTFCFELPLIAD